MATSGKSKGRPDLLWRIRDELLYRKGDIREGKFHKGRGGFYESKDAISKLSTDVLAKRHDALTAYRRKRYGNADT